MKRIGKEYERREDARIKTLKDLRGTVPSNGMGDFATERNRAKAAVAKRVRNEMK